jgi:hypothetical protein
MTDQQFGAMLLHLRVRTENSDADVVVMQSTEESM